MQEYFDQYAEEYVEESDPEPSVKYEKPVQKIPTVESLEDIVYLLKQQRAKDIVVLTDLSAHSIISSLIVCSPFNSRHGFAVAETLRRSTKSSDTQISKLSLRRNAGWFQVDIGSIQVNVMSEEVRERYDLESLWGVGEEEVEPEISLIPPPRQSL